MHPESDASPGTVEEGNVGFDSRGGEAMDGLLPPVPGESLRINEEGDVGCDSPGDEAMDGPLHHESDESHGIAPSSVQVHVVIGRVSMCAAESDLLDAAVPRVRCVDLVIQAGLAHRPPTTHSFLLCLVYSSSAHGISC